MSADFHVACFHDLRAWGGALSAARALAAVLRERGWTATRLGVVSGAARRASAPLAPDAHNVTLPTPDWRWRFEAWRFPRMLADTLRAIEPPRRAFISLSPFWILAAKRAWPRTPAVYLFPCLLTNCLPFTWEAPPAFWTRINYAGVRRAERLALRRADLTLTATDPGREEALEFCPLAAPRVRTRPFGYQIRTRTPEMRATARRELGVGDDTFVALACGVLDRNKAFDLLLDEAPLCRGAVHALLVGDGPRRAALERQARQRELCGRASLRPAQSDPSIWYAAADCVVSTSHYDTCPNAALEALGCGLPVVLPRHDPPRVFAGLSPVVERARAGLCYDRARRGALAAALDSLAEDPQDTLRMAARGKALVERTFRWEDVVHEIVARLALAAPCLSAAPPGASTPRFQPARGT